MSAASFFTACSVCFGNPDSLMSRGTKAGVLFLLVMVLVVLAGIFWTGWNWARRAARLER